MSDISRIEHVCKQIQDLWEMVPDWRIGQLFSNIQRVCAVPDMFFVTDEKFEEYINEFRQYLIDSKFK